MDGVLKDLIPLKEACLLLGVSRPTFDRIRSTHKFREVKIGRQIYFSRIELIRKVLVPQPLIGDSSYLILDHCDVDSLEVSNGVFDLRGLGQVDEFGAMSLLCLLKRRLKDSDASLAVLVRNSDACRYLKAIGFFTELKRGSQNLFVNDADIADSTVPPGSILALQMLGYRGAEKKILDHLYDSLQRQGFSENLCSRLGWTLGELADNAHTHAGGPCFITIVSSLSEPDAPKFLCMSVGDIGDGISTTLKNNPKYENLDTMEALFMAFKSSVTRWGDEANRGKGLNDLLAIGKGNKAWVRVESNGKSLFFDFRGDGLKQLVSRGSPSTKTQGARFSLVLLDSEFSDVSKQEIDALIDKEMGRRI